MLVERDGERVNLAGIGVATGGAGAAGGRSEARYGYRRLRVLVERESELAKHKPL